MTIDSLHDRRRSRFRQLIAVGCVFIFAVAIRLLPWNSVFGGGTVTFFDGDCYVRFRKILVYLQAFPEPYVYDYYQGYPVGTGIITPPILEYVTAAILYPFRSSPYLVSDLERLVSFVPPVIGGITAAFLYIFTRRKLGTLAALTAAIFLALAPPHIDATLLGRFDNEMAEPLFLLLVYWSYISTDRRQDLFPWIVSGTAGAIYLIYWRGALFPLAVIGVDLVCRLYATRNDLTERKRLAACGAAMYGVSAGIIGMVCLADPWQTGRLFTYHVISLFHLSLFALVALLLVATACFSGENPKRRLLGYGLLAIVAGSAVLLHTDIVAGLRIVVGGEAWIDTISEYVPGFSDVLNRYYYGIFGMVAPVALLVLRKDWRPLPARFLALWTIVMFAGTAGRLRFACYYAVSTALMAGLMVGYADTLRARVRLKPASVIIILLALVVLQGTCASYFIDTFRNGRGLAIGSDLAQTLTWLRNSTPSPGDPFRPDVKPSYGVMARWDLDGYIEAIALRPVVATAYGRETFGFQETAQVLFAGTDAEILSIMERTGTRYLVVDDAIIANLDDFAGYLGDERVFFEPHWDPARGTIVRIPTRDCTSLAVWRLMFADGVPNPARGTNLMPVEGLRLVYESPTISGGFPWQSRRFRVFELSRCATLVVRGRRGAEVEIIQQVESNNGDRFYYRCRKELGDGGEVRFKLPYRMKQEPGTVGAIVPVSVVVDGRIRSLSTTDRQMDNGAVLSVGAP